MIPKKKIKSEGVNPDRPSRDWSTIGFSLIAMLISVFAAYYSYRQVEIAEDTAHRQLRAYLGIRFKEWYGLKKPNDILAVGISIINYGQTPAKEMQIHGQIEILPFPLKENFIPEYSTIGNFDQTSAVFPEDTSLVGTVPAKRPFTSEEISEIKSFESKSRAYVFVRLTYLDCFNITHHTFICQFIDPKSIRYDPNGTIKTWIWANYWKYNDFN